jgi:hypothetical protein
MWEGKEKEVQAGAGCGCLKAGQSVREGSGLGGAPKSGRQQADKVLAALSCRVAKPRPGIFFVVLDLRDGGIKELGNLRFEGGRKVERKKGRNRDVLALTRGNCLLSSSRWDRSRSWLQIELSVGERR